jgi:2-polyprenyl-3-methyl-5-hydroxy-6-metoxy-1,4-benzoquinol methylase
MTDRSPAQQPGGFRYHYDIDESDENSVYTMELRMIGAAKRVLEFGCSSGFMTKALKERGCWVVGIDLNEEDAAGAARYADDLIIADLERDDFVAKLGGGSFDVLLFGDVLEHLRDPLATLREARELLAPGGFVVISVPNIAFVDVRMMLLRGAFEYRDDGLLDRTHVHFFTRASLNAMLDAAGLLVVETSRAIRQPFTSELNVDRGVPQDVVDLALEDAEALTYQFVVKAVLDDGDLSVRQLADRCRALEDRLHGIRVETELAVAVAYEAADARVAPLQQEIAELRNTRIFRYTAGARALYRKLVIGR